MSCDFLGGKRGGEEGGERLCCGRDGWDIRSRGGYCAECRSSATRGRISRCKFERVKAIFFHLKREVFEILGETASDIAARRRKYL